MVIRHWFWVMKYRYVVTYQCSTPENKDGPSSCEWIVPGTITE